MPYVQPTFKNMGDVITEKDWNIFVENFIALKAAIDSLPPPLPIGTIICVGNTTNPDANRFLACNGQEVSRTMFSELFAVIGTAYGAGNGSTTFNLPDMRGRTPICADNFGGAANRVPGASNPGNTGGSATHTLTVSEMPAHTHPPATGNFLGLTSGGGTTSLTTGTWAIHYNATTGSAGGGQPHNNLQPYIAFYWFIKYAL